MIPHRFFQAVRRDPHLRAFYQHLLAQGKPKMLALVAVMRKLLHAIFSMFKHYDPHQRTKGFPFCQGQIQLPPELQASRAA